MPLLTSQSWTPLCTVEVAKQPDTHRLAMMQNAVGSKQRAAQQRTKTTHTTSPITPYLKVLVLGSRSHSAHRNTVSLRHKHTQTRKVSWHKKFKESSH